MIPDYPEPPRFVAPARREEVTDEPEPAGDHVEPWEPGIDWIGSAQQGGGHVPDDFEWTSNPKRWQEELSAG